MTQQALTFRPLYLAYTQDAHLFFTSHSPDKLLHFPQSPVNPWLSLHSSPQRKLTARKIHCFSTCKCDGHACCFSTPWDWIPTSSGFYSCCAPLKFLLTYTFSLEMRTDPIGGTDCRCQQMEPCKRFHDGMYPEREAIGMLCLRHHVHHRPLGSGICDLRLWHVTLAEMSLCCSLLSNELFWVTMKICPWVISQIDELEA